MEDLVGEVDRLARERGLHGVVAVSGFGAGDFVRAYGLANRALGLPNTVDTQFATASGKCRLGSARAHKAGARISTAGVSSPRSSNRCASVACESESAACASSTFAVAARIMATAPRGSLTNAINRPS